MPQAGFDPPPVDDTSYEAHALRTKPPPWTNLNDISKTFKWVFFKVPELVLLSKNLVS